MFSHDFDLSDQIIIFNIFIVTPRELSSDVTVIVF